VPASIAWDLRQLSQVRHRSYALGMIEVTGQLIPHVQQLAVEDTLKPPPADVLVTFDCSVPRSTPTAAVILQTPSAPIGVRGRWRIARAASMADLVIAPSEAVSDALIRLLRVPAAKVVLAPPTLTSSGRPTWQEVAAARTNSKADKEYLVIADDTQELSGLRCFSLSDSPPRSDHRGLIGGAVAFVDRARDDGVAFAVHEALACGTPVIVARGSAGEEAMRGAGVAVDPRNKNGFRSAVDLLVANPGLRAGLSKRALDVAAGFADRGRLSGLASALDRLLSVAAAGAGVRGEDHRRMNRVRDRR
jgi:hypothetical protein